MQKDAIQMLKILYSTSEFGGLRTHQNNPAWTERVSLHSVEVGHYMEEELEEC